MAGGKRNLEPADIEVSELLLILDFLEHVFDVLDLERQKFGVVSLWVFLKILCFLRQIAREESVLLRAVVANHRRVQVYRRASCRRSSECFISIGLRGWRISTFELELRSLQLGDVIEQVILETL